MEKKKGLNSLKRLNFNKKGDIPSLILAVVLMFIVAILLLFFQQLKVPLYNSLDQYFENSEFNDTLAHDALQELQHQDVEQNIWDYASLAIIFGIVIALILTAYATRVSVAFFWIYIIASMAIIVLGVIMGNIWEAVATDPTMATAITAFPITNLILGNSFSLWVAAFMFIFIMVLFGKTPQQAGGGFK